MLLPKCILWSFSILLLQIYCISFRATVIGTFSVLWSISLCSSYKMLVCFSFSSSSVIIFVLFWWISYGFFVCSVSLDLMIFFRFFNSGFLRLKVCIQYSTIRPYHISCHGVSQSVYQRANGKWSFGKCGLWSCSLDCFLIPLRRNVGRRTNWKKKQNNFANISIYKNVIV